MGGPAHLDGALFEAVQRDGVFEDSKTFVDSVPRTDPDEIRRRFEERRTDPGFDLQSFVEEHFRLPQTAASGVPTNADTVEEHVRQLWPLLVVESSSIAADRGSLIRLPEQHVTPGGRFRELYYWDSYFIAEGLAACGELDRVENLVENFAWLIAEYGRVPNANREYYRTRSQPPMFASLLGILERERGFDAVEPYLPQLEREYEFWMDGRESLTGQSSTRRVVNLPAGTLNRYWDDAATPRPESYREDVALAERTSERDAADLHRNVRAACESGWDFSGRWFAGDDLGSIRTTELVPVDLNATLYGVERSLARWCEAAGDADAAAQYARAAEARTETVEEYCWDADAGFYFDYHAPGERRSDKWTLAAVSPLFFGLADDERAAAVADALESKFLREGGLVTTLSETGQQWDAPNGWAPLHWLAVIGLERYGHDDLAREIATRWIRLVDDVFERTGKVVEKYNVQNTSLRAGGGEYPLQDGFGWTNGVTMALKERFDCERPPPA